MPGDDVVATRRRRMLDLVERFYDAGERNQTRLALHVAAGMAGHDDAVEDFLGEAEPPLGGPTPDWSREWEGLVNRAPRGAWALLRLEGGWMSLISDGSGGGHLPMQCRTYHEERPAYAGAYRGMVGQEAYDFLSKARAGAAARAVARHGVKAGDAYPGPIAVGGSRLFSVRVTNVDGGTVHLSGFRKGSNIMRSAPIECDDLAHQVDLSAARTPDPAGLADDAILNWMALARAVFDRIHAATEWGRGHVRDGSMEPGSVLHAGLGKARVALPVAGAPWTDDATRALVEAADGTAPTLSTIGSHAGADVLATASALRIAQAAIRDRPGDILGADEARVLAEAAAAPALKPAIAAAAADLAGRATPVPQAAAVLDVRPSLFNAAFSWDRREGRSRGHARATSSGVEVYLGEPADPYAPVALRLATPGGGWLDVRCVDGKLMRPVLSPGTWEPAGVAAFVDAATAGVPWADNPFAPRSADMPLTGVRDVATPEARPRPYDEDRKRAMDAATFAAGRLRVVDGVVHCPAGHLRVLPIRSDAITPRYGWRTGTLTCLDGMDGLRLANVGIQVHDVGMTGGWGRRTRGNHLTSLPAHDSWRLPDILRHLDAIGLPPDADPAACIRFVEPHLVRTEDDAPFRAMRDWAEMTLRQGGRYTPAVNDFLEDCRSAVISAAEGRPTDVPDASRLAVPDDAVSLLETLSDWGAESARRLSVEDAAELATFSP